MSGRFVSREECQEIRAEWWDPDEHVVIKKFAYGDRQYLAGEALKVGLSTTDGKAESVTDVQVARMNLAILNRGIRSWTLKGENGKIAPLNRAMIEDLHEEDAEFILEAINDYNPQRDRRSPAEQAAFRGADGDRAEGGDGAASGDE